MRTVLMRNYIIIRIIKEERLILWWNCQNGHWCAFEVKLGSSQIDQAASNLLKISRELKEESNNAPEVLCVLCGLSNAAYCREDGVFVVPITALRP